MNEKNRSEGVLVDDKLFRRLVADKATEINEDKRRGLMKTKDVCGLLKFSSHRELGRHIINDPRTKLRRSALHGKWIASSVYDEIDRIIEQDRSN